jgi:NTP pyrophosphatase (non-canonical NTP hydrolase)
MANKEKIYQSAVARYGSEAQLNMLIEECAELTKAICKYRRAAFIPILGEKVKLEKLFRVEEMMKLVDDIIEETADVLVMIEQLPYILPGYTNDITEKIKTQKIERLSSRIGASK